MQRYYGWYANRTRGIRRHEDGISLPGAARAA